MPSPYARTLAMLAAEPRHWLLTGCAGFIGSHLLAKLLETGQHVAGLDDFSTGKRANLEEIRAQVGQDAWNRFRLVEGDIRERAICRDACRGAGFVLHHAALVSVPLSIEDPLRCNGINVDGFLNVLDAARDVGVKRFVYASSSAVYGDSPAMPACESAACLPNSPYGTSKFINELYAAVFSRNYGISTTGLRYFNVFGTRQDPTGGYAAVIPKWIASALRREPCAIHGDGCNTRDFCHVDNVVQANILAAMSPVAGSEVFNVGLGERTSLNELSALIGSQVRKLDPSAEFPGPVHGPARSGDIMHSHADISKIRRQLGFEPLGNLAGGVQEMARWFADHAG